jgi:site-specific recombinase XerC
VDIHAFLAMPSLKAWHGNVARGSRITADVYARSLRLFCHLSKTEPASLLRLSETDLHTTLLDFVTSEEKRKQAGSSTATHLKAVRSWLTFNGVRITRPVKVRRVQETPTLADERTPSQEELRRVLLAATIRNRVSCALMAFSGVRPEVLGSYLGDDGLRIKDLPELRVQGSTVRFDRVPAMVVVRPVLSKAGHRYFTFLGEEGCGYVTEYLRARIEEGESLGPETDIVHAEAGHSTLRGGNQFIRTVNVGDGIRLALRQGGFPWRPYVLRAYFDTQLLMAESKGKVAHDYRVFWMGHKGSMEARYTTNKGRLPQTLVDDMREAYRRCEPFLSTVPSRNEQDAQAKMAKTMLMGLGYTESELSAIDFDNLDVALFQDLVTKKMASAAASAKQQLVDADELPRYLAQGWTVVTAVNGHQVVLNPPASR